MTAFVSNYIFVSYLQYFGDKEQWFYQTSKRDALMSHECRVSISDN